MSLFFTADTHFYDIDSIQHFNRPFSSVEEMNEKIVENWNASIKPTDFVYHLGDFARCQNAQDREKLTELLGRLNGQKFLIRGNHDNKIVRNLKGWVTTSTTPG